MAEDSGARVAVITGASSGIGLEAAKALAAAGWRVIGQGRDPARTAIAAELIARAAGVDGRTEMLCADLSLLREAGRLADEIAGRTGRVDVLLNNAGGLGAERRVTDEGNEATFAGNHLGHFLLTRRLLPLLRIAAAAEGPGAVRVINTSSSAHAGVDGLDWDDLQSLANFNPGLAYNRAKLANLLFTRALAQRLAADAITVHAVHPGVVDTNFFNPADPVMQRYREAHRQTLLSPAEGADTLLWLATAESPGGDSGGYFHARRAVSSSPAGADVAAAERLWTESEKIISRAGL